MEILVEAGHVDEARALVGSVWSFRPEGHAAPPDAVARAFGVVVGRHINVGRVDCALLRLDRCAARSGRASNVLEGCAYVGLVEHVAVGEEASPEGDAALVAAALELARAWAQRTRG